MSEKWSMSLQYGEVGKIGKDSRKETLCVTGIPIERSTVDPACGGFFAPN